MALKKRDFVLHTPLFAMIFANVIFLTFGLGAAVLSGWGFVVIWACFYAVFLAVAWRHFDLIHQPEKHYVARKA